MASYKYAGILIYAVKPGVKRTDDKLVFLLGGELNRQDKLKYGNLGGKVEPGEKVDQAAMRETLEEIMYLLPPIDVSGDKTILTDDTGTVYLHQIPYSDDIITKFKSALALARYHGMLNGTAKSGYFEIRDLKWVTMNQLKGIVKRVKGVNIPIDGDAQSFPTLFLKSNFINVMSVIAQNMTLQ